jgi:hypothetical protein
MAGLLMRFAASPRSSLEVSTKALHPTLKRAFWMLAVGAHVGTGGRRLKSINLLKGLA